MFGAAWRLTATGGPPAWALAAFGLVAGALGAWLRAPRRAGVWASPLLGFACALAAWASLGAGAVDLRVAGARAPMLPALEGPVRVSGWVAAIEAGESRPRMKIRVHEIEGMAEPPLYIRVSPPRGTVLSPGRAVRCRAILSPPSDPIVPEAYDPARPMFFQRIGGVGFSLGGCRPMALPAPPWPLQLELWLAAVRRDLAEHIAGVAPGAGGAVAAAVLAGDRTLMAPETQAAFQNSGLAHLLSVSGLHMGLAAGLAFGAFYAGLAWIPRLGLVLPLRKIAAGSALVCALGYLLLTGASLPAQRAFIMTAAALGAVLFDRRAFTMRALAAAAVCVVLLAPESVLDAGFQMSFAATAALVAWFEARPEPQRLPSPGWIIGGLQALWGGVQASLMVSFVAGLAADPIAAFHFQRVSLYGLAANLAASPVISLIVAPAALASVLFSPLGWDGPLQLAAWGLALVAGVGEAFGARPEAVQWLPAAPPVSLLLLLIGMAWAAIWRGWLRWLGAAPVACALGAALLTPQPVLLVDREARAVLARTDQGWAIWRAGAGGRFEAERLAGRAGLDPRHLEAIPSLSCGLAACRWRTPGGREGLLRLLPEAECGEAAFGLDLADGACARLVGRAALRALGGAAAREGRDGMSWRFSAEEARPWRR